MTRYDAIIVGSGPNGLAAAIVLAQRGLAVLVREANSTLGGGARTLPLTIPGFLHDSGSAVHPMGLASPFFQTLPLADHGLQWIQPPIPLAHPLGRSPGDEPAAALHRSIPETAQTVAPDADPYRRLLGPIVRNWPHLLPQLLGPILHWPSHPFQLAQFGLHALLPATTLNRHAFRAERARALFAGLAAHSIVALDRPATSAFGLVLAATAHTVGWPIPRGGAQSITNALAAHLHSLGGIIETYAPLESLAALPPSRAVLLDVTPRQALRIAGDALPHTYRAALERFRPGPGIFKIDWALAGPIPWADPLCSHAGTVHLGGSAAEIAASEHAAWHGHHSDRPFVLLAQPSLFDPTRAPAQHHTAWAYCHVPNGSALDRTAIIEAQVERFAPGFHDLILARTTMNAPRLQQSNANLLGGDISGGANNLLQTLFRPVPSLDPYRTPTEGLYLCSSSTPPGGGVHGMCGYHAAQSALKHTFA
jgi:phytoene dehydrogenase-like protein